MTTRPTEIRRQPALESAEDPSQGPPTDRELLRRFASKRDEAAFAMLVQRHGAMILRTGERVLHSRHAAEDVSQATFMVLARKAASLRWQPSIGKYLYKVAYRLAQEAKAAVQRRQAHEGQAARRNETNPSSEASLREADAVLHEEVACLPEALRLPIVWRYYEGRSREEIAQQLQCSAKTLDRRLERARELLRMRLTKRGMALSPLLLTCVLEKGATRLPAAWIDATVQVAVNFAAHRSAVATACRTALLAEGVLQAMFVTKMKLASVVLVSLIGLVAGGEAARRAWIQTEPTQPSSKEEAKPRTKQPGPRTSSKKTSATDIYGGPLPPGTPILGSPLWKQKTIQEAKTLEWVCEGAGSAVEVLKKRGQPILPAFFPIAVTVQRDHQLVPLVIYRSYWGVHALNLQSGEWEWESPSNWSLDRVNDQSSPVKYSPISQWIQKHNAANNNGIVFENSTLGTLSSDGVRAYAVEDLAVPPPSQKAQGAGQNVNKAVPSAVNNAIQHNKLLAFNLLSGKLEWELGGRAPAKEMNPSDPFSDRRKILEGPSSKADKKIDLRDSYFLGPPLPLAGKLYVLNEKNQELRLVALDPVKLTEETTAGKFPHKEGVLWVQPLASVRDKMTQDVGRRIHAALLSYSDGVMVCPTNAGAVFGVDLASQSMIWACSYRKANDTATPIDSGWKASPPFIEKGKVVFTAPDDASALHCVNLRDGKLIWEDKRRPDDLYVEGVFSGRVLIVGSHSCRAVSLADGRTVWEGVKTGLPSGRGVVSENLYYLPLQSSDRDNKPEVCIIDILQGRVVAHARSRKNEVPGNLLFYEGRVVSQTVNEIAAYPQIQRSKR